MTEALDAAFGQEGDSEEEDAVVNQVLDEIGISLNEKVLILYFSAALGTSLFLSNRFRSFRWQSRLAYPLPQPLVLSRIDDKYMRKMRRSNECWPI